MSKKYEQNQKGLEELKEESQILALMLSQPGVTFSKQQLVAYTNKSERAVRSELERIANFYPVRATAGRKGYTIIHFDDDSSIDELKAANNEAFDQMRELQNRIDSLKARMKPLIATMRVTALKLQEQEQ